MSYKYTIDSSAAAPGSSVYTEANGEGTVSFCSRVGLVDYDINGNAIYVNFRQMLTTINYDLSVEGIPVSQFYTRAIEEATGGADVDLGATATVCEGYGQQDGDIDPFFNQGQEVCINICADDTLGLDADVISIDQLVLNINNQPTIAQQVLIFGGSPVGNAIEYDCTSAEGCCTARFLMENSFFPVDENQDPSEATVTGTGEATISLNGNRRKLSIRGLQAIEATKTDETKFEGEFNIMQYDNGLEEESSAFSTTFSAAILAGAAGAALMI
jgi:hypothetical protein